MLHAGQSRRQRRKLPATVSSQLFSAAQLVHAPQLPNLDSRTRWHARRRQLAAPRWDDGTSRSSTVKLVQRHLVSSQQINISKRWAARNVPMASVVKTTDSCSARIVASTSFAAECTHRDSHRQRHHDVRTLCIRPASQPKRSRLYHWLQEFQTAKPGLGACCRRDCRCFRHMYDGTQLRSCAWVAACRFNTATCEMHIAI